MRSLSWSTSLEHVPLQAAEMARRQLTRVMGFEPPSREAAAAGTRPPLREPDHFEPSTVQSGWQHEASARVEERYREDLFNRTTGAGTGALPSKQVLEQERH